MGKPYISRVQISNFRNFKEFDAIFEPTAVIVGENRVGKSNLLYALRLILDPSLPDSARMLSGEDFWDGLDQPFGGHIIEVKVYLEGFDDNKSAKGVLADCIVSQRPLTALLTYQFRPRKSVEPRDATEEKYEFIVFGGSNEKHRVGSDVRHWVAMTLLPALRDAESDVQSWKKSPLRPLLERARKLLGDEKLVEIRQSIDEATKVLISEPPIKRLIEDINACIGEMIGPVHTIKTQLDFAASEPAQLMRSIRLFLEETEKRPLSSASLGTTNVLFLALLLHDLDERIDAKDLVSAVLAIEEPEAHLHPHLQRLLFRHFINRGHCVLVTTHSPNIASVSPINCLIFLKNVKGQSKAYTARDLNLTKQQCDDMQRYLDVTRAEMLFAKGVIFVEGMAEEFLIPAFADSVLQRNGIARSLDDLGISVCSVNGTDFAPYSKLLSDKGLSIPNVIVTDGDPGETGFHGITRGIKLLEDESTRAAIRGLAERDEYRKARKELGKAGIFVGDITLEVDLVATLADEMKEAFGELSSSTKSQGKFNEAIDNYERAGSAEIIVSRIERIGKGRFGQRLASKIRSQDPPTYIASAVNHIVEAVYPHDA